MQRVADVDLLFAANHVPRGQAKTSPLFKQQLPIVSIHRPPVAAAPPSPSPITSEAEALPNCSGAENCTVIVGNQLSERDRLVQAMEQAGWVKAKAARLLNLTPRQIGYALQKHAIPVKKF